jgi:hypothetical protein
MLVAFEHLVAKVVPGFQFPGLGFLEDSAEAFGL